ncbi:hypothetical protein NUW54_g14366 [Trametes sanguinea]|uniref:Uncharacterized protein n=1 Tax=Trametes sanguinea TaxID=158606 RepID=A0ACC1MD66_9APHY|nr:hypothetical protein NUW54_g14366 [Trametes sanguinea]
MIKIHQYESMGKLWRWGRQRSHSRNKSDVHRILRGSRSWAPLSKESRNGSRWTVLKSKADDLYHYDVQLVDYHTDLLKGDEVLHRDAMLLFIRTLPLSKTNHQVSPLLLCLYTLQPVILLPKLDNAVPRAPDQFRLCAGLSSPRLDELASIVRYRTDVLQVLNERILVVVVRF